MLTHISLLAVSTATFAELIGDDIVPLIFEAAPTKVASRVGKALDHFTEAKRLCGIDDEMGALRCIAAEEELVVAILEWLKLNADKSQITKTSSVKARPIR